MPAEAQEIVRTTVGSTRQVDVAVLTGCKDPHYAFGLCTSLAEQGASVAVVGEEAAGPRAAGQMTGIRFADLRSNKMRERGKVSKVLGWMRYYVRLALYTSGYSPRIFHILWNNKIEQFDRTLMMLWYKLFGKHVVLTAHNANQGRRDGRDSLWNRFTLSWQYRLADHIFVHTQMAKRELCADFGVKESAVSVIVYGINNAVPDSGMDPCDAKRRMGVGADDRTILFFGGIKAYKGLEYLVEAFRRLPGGNYRLIVAGERKNDAVDYYRKVQAALDALDKPEHVIAHIGFVPDNEAEVYFKAADVIVLPYREIFQSGILFLAYSFGLPAIVTDVGSLAEEVVQGVTGYVCRPEDPDDLAASIQKYFASELYLELNASRKRIQEIAVEQHSWKHAAEETMKVYSRLLS